MKLTNNTILYVHIYFCCLITPSTTPYKGTIRGQPVTPQETPLRRINGVSQGVTGCPLIVPPNNHPYLYGVVCLKSEE